ncbi:hypothetical protein ACJX0J_018561, partial [Zea mays]
IAAKRINKIIKKFFNKDFIGIKCYVSLHKHGRFGHYQYQSEDTKAHMILIQLALINRAIPTRTMPAKWIHITGAELYYLGHKSN